MFISLSGTPAFDMISKSKSCLTLSNASSGVINETNVQCFLHFQTSFHHYSQLTYCIPCSSPSSESILTVTQLLFDDWCNSVSHTAKSMVLWSSHLTAFEVVGKE